MSLLGSPYPIIIYQNIECAHVSLMFCQKLGAGMLDDQDEPRKNAGGAVDRSSLDRALIR